MCMTVSKDLQKKTDFIHSMKQTTTFNHQIQFGTGTQKRKQRQTRAYCTRTDSAHTHTSQKLAS